MNNTFTKLLNVVRDEVKIDNACIDNFIIELIIDSFSVPYVSLLKINSGA